jgi:hypothetical protein
MLCKNKAPPPKIVLRDITKGRVVQGEMLGPVALHMMIAAVTQFYKVHTAIGKICCDNILALGQSSKTRKRFRTGIK